MSTRQVIEQELAGLPEPLRREVCAFARLPRFKRQDESFNGLLLNESAIAKEWNNPEEDATWANL